jgi:transcription antitermination factor NusG
MNKRNEEKLWYVLRDLKRPNAKERAYQMLPRISNGEIEVYTPMTKKVVKTLGKEIYEDRPYLPDLLFVHEKRSVLDPIIASIDTLQYRLGKGNSLANPMTVRTEEMERFMRVVKSDEQFVYYSPEEVSENLYGKHIRIVGGPLNGLTGRLMTKRGSKSRKLIVDLEQILSAVVEVQPEYIQLIKEDKVDNNK